MCTYIDIHYIYIYMYAYIFVGLILIIWHRRTHIYPQMNRQIIVDPAGIEHATSRLIQHCQLPVVQHNRFVSLKLYKKHNPTGILEVALDNWLPVWKHRCRFQLPGVLISKCALNPVICIFAGLFFMLWHLETHINPQRKWSSIVDPAGIELTTSRLRQYLKF